MCAAPVESLIHWKSLTVYTKSFVPGDKPKLKEVKEQRLTNLAVHALLSLGLLFRIKTIRIIPASVLFGVFLYFGIISISGTQLYERIRFTFIPFKYCPNLPYAVGVSL